MVSFFPPDYAEQPRFLCQDCDISATVRGEALVSLMQVQIQRCTDKGHKVRAENFDINPE